MGKSNVLTREEVDVQEPREAEAGDLAQKVVRLSVNLSSSVAAALRALMSAHGTSATEEIRRAVSMRKFLQDEAARGNKVIIESPDGEDRRELLIDVY